MDLWGDFSTWEVIDYDGAFFRAEGTDAEAFIEKTGVLVKQSEGLPDITGSISVTFSGATYGSASGAFYKSASDLSKTQEASAYEHYAGTYSFSASRSSSIYGESSHVTPVNYTYRIWKRIA